MARFTRRASARRTGRGTETAIAPRAAHAPEVASGTHSHAAASCDGERPPAAAPILPVTAVSSGSATTTPAALTAVTAGQVELTQGVTPSAHAATATATATAACATATSPSAATAATGRDRW